MYRNATPESAILFTKLCISLTGCWPLSASATKSQALCFKILRSILLLNAFVLFLPLLYALRVYRNDPENVVKAACLTIAVLQNLLQTILGITLHDRFQPLVEEMKICCRKAKSYERRVFQRYLDKYCTFYGIAAVWCYMTAFLVLLGALITPDSFPTNAQYPFPVNFEPVRTIIFVHQAIVGFQCSAHVCINVFTALLLLFTAARFEILMIELREITDENELAEYMKRYMELRKYAKDMINSIRCIILMTITACGTATVFSGINLIGHQPFSVKIQFLFIIGAAMLEVFMCSWPASDLIDTSENVMQGAYDSIWYEQSLRMQRSMLIMLAPQSPIVLQIKCIISALSLNYYCSFVTNVFSSFTALRIVMLKEDNENAVD